MEFPLQYICPERRAQYNTTGPDPGCMQFRQGTRTCHGTTTYSNGFAWVNYDWNVLSNANFNTSNASASVEENDSWNRTRRAAGGEEFANCRSIDGFLWAERVSINLCFLTFFENEFLSMTDMVCSVLRKGGDVWRDAGIDILCTWSLQVGLDASSHRQSMCTHCEIVLLSFCCKIADRMDTTQETPADMIYPVWEGPGFASVLCFSMFTGKESFLVKFDYTSACCLKS